MLFRTLLLLLLLVDVESLNGLISQVFVISIWIRLSKKNISFSFFIRQSIYYVHVRSRPHSIHTHERNTRWWKIGSHCSHTISVQAGRQANTVSWKEKHKVYIHFEVNLCIIIWFLLSLLLLLFILVFDSLNNFFKTAVWQSVFVFVVIGVRRWIAIIITIIIIMLSLSVVSQIYKCGVVLRSRSQSSIDYNNLIFYFNFTALNLHFYLHSCTVIHSLVFVCAHTPQTSSAIQCTY